MERALPLLAGILLTAKFVNHFHLSHLLKNLLSTHPHLLPHSPSRDLFGSSVCILRSLDFKFSSFFLLVSLVDSGSASFTCARAALSLPLSHLLRESCLFHPQLLFTVSGLRKIDLILVPQCRFNFFAFKSFL